MSDAKPKTNRGNAGKGRPKGARNKVTSEVKEMVLQALDEAGGVDYLRGQANANPNAFMSLLGKVLPLQVTGDANAPLTVAHEIILRGVSPQ